MKKIGIHELAKETLVNDIRNNIGIFKNWEVSSFVAKDLKDTEYHQAFVVNSDSYGYTFGDDDRPERLIEAFFSAIALLLAKKKIAKTDTATALVLTDMAGVFKFAAFVEYHDNTENPDEPGNWSLSLTFNADDLAALKKRKTVSEFSMSGPDFKKCYDDAGYDVGSFQFQHSSYIIDACHLIVDTIIQILDREAKENDTVDIECPNYFVASVSVEDGEKIMAITPEGHMKAIIKDDAALSEK